jgi:uncharacterized membrane protein YhiD involved in acid resistance
MTHENEHERDDKQPLSTLGMWGVAILIPIIISMISFWLTQGREYITRAEAKDMVDQKHLVVVELMQAQQKNENKLEIVLDKNTEAIQQLKIQLATLNQTLEFLRDTTKDVNSRNK